MPISFPDPEYCLAFSLESKELLLLSTFNCLNRREEKFRDVSNRKAETAKHAVGRRLALESGLRLYKSKHSEPTPITTPD